jgi:hypothetical protein
MSYHLSQQSDLLNDQIFLQTKETKILEGNVAKEENIMLLRNRWLCHSPKCGGTHCFVPPDDAEHFLLSMKHLDIWAAAMV